MTCGLDLPRSDGVDNGAALEAVAEERVAALEAENAVLKVAVATLTARVAELERQAGLNSTNSSKPPSSDGLKKQPRTTSLREPSGLKPGGQKGHKGETLRQVEEPTVTINHFPASCSGCGSALVEASAIEYSARQVFDLPEPQPLIVTEHRAHTCQCDRCGTRTRAPYPDDVTAPVQYGPRITAFVLYLLHYQFVPEDRLVELMAHLFNVHLAAATIARMSTNCAQRFQGFVAAVLLAIKAALVKNLDETGFRIGGKGRWLHIACTPWLTFYRISPKRGSMLEGATGVAVHDHFKSYYTMKDVLHALCNAHHLRELKALIEIEKERWALKMQRLLRRACHATNLARDHDHSAVKPGLVALIQRKFDAVITEGLAFHEAQPPLTTPRPKGAPKRRGRSPRRTGHNLVERLRTHKDEVLRFLMDMTVPFTNNLAEQAARMMKLRQKISGGFRSEQGAHDFAVIRSVIATAKKQGWNIVHTLTQSPEALIAKLRIA